MPNSRLKTTFPATKIPNKPHQIHNESQQIPNYLPSNSFLQHPDLISTFSEMTRQKETRKLLYRSRFSSLLGFPVNCNRSQTFSGGVQFLFPLSGRCQIFERLHRAKIYFFELLKFLLF
jgi:hypothetical protein